MRQGTHSPPAATASIALRVGASGVEAQPPKRGRHSRVRFAELERLPTRTSGQHYSWSAGGSRARLLSKHALRSDSAADMARSAMCSSVALPACALGALGAAAVVVSLHAIPHWLHAGTAALLLIGLFVGAAMVSLAITALAQLWYMPSPNHTFLQKKRKQQERSLLWIPSGVAILIALGLLRTHAPQPLAPPLYDVTTSPEEPPSYSPSYAAKYNTSFPRVNAGIIRANYPAIHPLHTTLRPADAAARAAEVCDELGWALVWRAEPAPSVFELQATFSSPILKYDATDIAIRIRPRSGGRGEHTVDGALVDIRSRSRDRPQGDFGLNEMTILRFLTSPHWPEVVPQKEKPRAVATPVAKPVAKQATATRGAPVEEHVELQARAPPSHPVHRPVHPPPPPLASSPPTSPPLVPSIPHGGPPPPIGPPRVSSPPPPSRDSVRVEPASGTIPATMSRL